MILARKNIKNNFRFPNLKFRLDTSTAAGLKTYLLEIVVYEFYDFGCTLPIDIPAINFVLSGLGTSRVDPIWFWDLELQGTLHEYKRDSEFVYYSCISDYIISLEL